MSEENNGSELNLTNQYMFDDSFKDGYHGPQVSNPILQMIGEQKEARVEVEYSDWKNDNAFREGYPIDESLTNISSFDRSTEGGKDA